MARIGFSLLGALFIGQSPTPAAARTPELVRPTLAEGTVTLHAGASVAGPDGAQWTLPGGPRIIARPGAVLRVLNAPQPLLLGPGAAVAGYTLVVKTGKVEVQVPPRAKSAVVVIAPRQVHAIVRTGVFRVAATSSRCAVANTSGGSTYSVTGSSFRDLPEDHVFVLEGRSAAARSLPDPPSRIEGHRLLVTPADRAELGKLTWEAVGGAAGYRAELLDEQSGKRIGSADTSTPVLEHAFGALAVGRYRLLISSYDSSGIAGGRALETTLRVVGMGLPPGAYVDSAGAVRLGVGQQVQFVGAEGLEMTYGGDHFVRASERVGLYRNERTLVHLRIPGTHDFATARLGPRTVRARIQIGPSRAVWPNDPIEIRVRLVDPSGEPIPASIEAKPKVTLGVREIDVPFVRRGSWLRGVVRPRAGAGPWVLRVAVEDGAEQHLGYDFLEIGRAPRSGAERAVAPARIDALSRR